jgi:putative hemolysin
MGVNIMDARNCSLPIMILLASLALAACNAPFSGSVAAPSPAGLANPASVHCQEQGGTHEIRQDGSGGTYGVCVFSDGSECEEWAFFNGECQPGMYQQTEDGLNSVNVVKATGLEESVSFDQVRAGDNYASPHNFNLAFEYYPIPLRFEEAHLPTAPAGALWSNVLDMARFLITELNEGISPDGTRVVSADNLTLTWEPQVTIAGSASYGLGWLVDDYMGLLMIEHGGGTFGGFTSDLTFLPEVELGIVVLTNQRASLLNQAVRFRLFELLFQQEQKVDVQLQLKEAIAGLDKQVGERVDPEMVDPYLGTYTSDTLGEVTVTLQNGGKLLFDTGGYWNELRPKVGEDGSYLFYENPNVLGWAVTFTTDGKGSVAMTVAGNTFEKVE